MKSPGGSAWSVEYIYWETLTTVQNLVPIHQVSLEVFHCISADFDLPVSSDKKSGDEQVIRIHPLGTMIHSLYQMSNR